MQRLIAIRYVQAALDKLIIFLLSLTGIGAGSFGFDTGEYEVIKRIRKHFGSAITVFDVGAHTGEYSTAVREHIPDSRIYAFEPALPNFKTAQAKTAGAHITLENLALGRFIGNSEIQFSDEFSGASSIYERTVKGGKNAKSLTINMTTLDAYCSANNIEQIDFLKMDVEGYEMEVLQGATEMLKNKKIAAIQFEFGRIYGRMFFHDFWQLLKDDYTFFRILPGGLRPVTFYHEHLETFATSNYLAVRKGFKIR